MFYYFFSTLNSSLFCCRVLRTIVKTEPKFFNRAHWALQIGCVLRDRANEVSGNRTPVRDGVIALRDEGVNIPDSSFNLRDGASDVRDSDTNLRDRAIDMSDNSFNLRDRAVCLRDGDTKLRDGAMNLRDSNMNPRDGGLNLSDRVLSFCCRG